MSVIKSLNQPGLQQLSRSGSVDVAFSVLGISLHILTFSEPFLSFWIFSREASAPCYGLPLRGLMYEYTSETDTITHILIESFGQSPEAHGMTLT